MRKVNENFRYLILYRKMHGKTRVRLREEREMSNREKEDLERAITGDKFWWVSSKRRDLVYVVALTTADFKRGKRFLAKVTFLKKILIPHDLAIYVRRGRVLVVSLKDKEPISVVTWPALYKLMKIDEKIVYEKFTRNPPKFVSLSNIKGIFSFS